MCDADRERKLLGLLGLAARSGRLTYGQDRCLAGVRDGALFLIIVDGDASGNTKKALRNACLFHKVPLIELSSAGRLGAGVGRPALRVVGVKDRLFAQQLRSGYETGAEV